MFSKLKDAFNSFSDDAERSISEKVRESVTEKEITLDILEEPLDELRMNLLKNNVALDVVDAIEEQIKEDLIGRNIQRFSLDEAIQESIHDTLEDILNVDGPDLEEVIERTEKPCLILFMGFNGSGKCVSGDTRIYTEKGPIPAETLYETCSAPEKQEEKGWYKETDTTVHTVTPDTLKSKTQNASRVWKLPADEQIKIQCETGKEVTVTPEHPFFTLREGAIVKQPARSIQDEDFIMAPSQILADGELEQFVDKLSERYYVESAETFQQFKNYINSVESLRGEVHPLLEDHGFDKSALYYWQDTGKIPISICRDIDLPIPTTAIISAENGGKMDVPRKPTPALAEWLGMFLAEGHTDHNSVHIHNQNEAFVERLQHLYREVFSITPSTREEDGLYRVSSGRRVLRYFLEDVFDIDKSKHEIVKTVVTWPNQCRAAFVRGLFSGDGHVSSKKRSIALASSSQELIEYLQVMLLGFGILSSSDEKTVEEGTYYRIRVAGDKKLQRWQDKIGFSIPSKRRALEQRLSANKQFERTELVPHQGTVLKQVRKTAELTQQEIGEKLGVLDTMVHHYESDSKISKDKLTVYSELTENEATEFLRTLGQGDVSWIRVTSTERQHEDEYVYDLTVPETHNFIANGIVVHNTTSLAKTAYRIQDEYGVVLAAGDTFRAASIEQLQEHADNLDLPVIAHEYGSDAAAVVYDAVQHAEKEGKDVVLADTAGRSHADENLMDALEKICRVNEPDYRILVVDALAGNDVLNQAEEYTEIGFDAVILAKADVDEKGGAALSLVHETGKPILFLGTGQDYPDLERFDADAFIDQVL